MSAGDIYQETTRYFLSPVQSLMDDESVSEIMIIGHDAVYFERAGLLHRAPPECRFRNEEVLLAAAQNIAEYVNRQLDTAHHSIDARLPNGSRVHVIIPPCARNGICITIRKFQKSSFDLEALVKKESLSEQAAEFLQMCVLLHKNIVISGGTGTGKTSMLNALSSAIPENERIIVIEDSSELQLHQPHTVYLEAQSPGPDGERGVSIRDLFVDSLRMRPDRIIVGEVRRGEALDLIQSMISGHAGALTTVHANTPRDAIARLETLCLMSDVELPLHVARVQLASAITIVVQLARLADGSRRVQTISEVLELDVQNRYCLQDVFTLQTEGYDDSGRIIGRLTPTGTIPTFTLEPFQMGLGAHIQTTQGLFGQSRGSADVEDVETA